MASYQYDIVFCSETLVSDTRHVSELLVPGFGRPSFCIGAGCLGPAGWLQTYEMVTEHFADLNLSAVVAK